MAYFSREFLFTPMLAITIDSILFFRTFFGGAIYWPYHLLNPPHIFVSGSDDSWATPNTVHSYFRNIQMWGGQNPSSLTGPVIKSSAISQHPACFVLASIIVGTVAALV